MDFYQISDLEKLSGIKAHTIRIWEKRYNIIAPQRTDTNIRYYNDAQLKKLLNVATLSQNGYKISKIAEYSNTELKKEINQLFQSKETSTQHAVYIQELTISMLDFDEEKFDKLIGEMIENFGVENSIINIVYPFLNATGVLWRIDKATPIQEHFASALIKRKILYFIETLPKVDKQSKFILLFLPTNEWHEITILFAEYMIRSRGINTINLGQNVPITDMEYVIRKKKPKYLLGFLISEDNANYIQEINTLLINSFPNTICLLSGNADKLKQIQESKNLKLLFEPNDLLKFI